MHHPVLDGTAIWLGCCWVNMMDRSFHWMELPRNVDCYRNYVSSCIHFSRGHKELTIQVSWSQPSEISTKYVIDIPILSICQGHRGKSSLDPTLSWLKTRQPGKNICCRLGLPAGVAHHNKGTSSKYRCGTSAGRIGLETVNISHDSCQL